MASVTTAEWEDAERKVLVTWTPCFDLPTACPTYLSVFLYLHMAQVPFDIHVDTSFPDVGEFPPPSLSHSPYQLKLWFDVLLGQCYNLPSPRASVGYQLVDSYGGWSFIVAAMPLPACSAASSSTAVDSFKKIVVLLDNAGGRDYVIDKNQTISVFDTLFQNTVYFQFVNDCVCICQPNTT
jgi:hypothetical protein